MTSDLRDDVPLPHFEDRLWAELSRLHPDAQGSPQSSGPSRVRPLRRRRRYPLFAGLGVVATAAAAVAAVVIVSPDTASDTGAPADVAVGDTGDGAEPPASLESTIVAAIDEALADSIVHSYLNITHGARGDEKSWEDDRSDASRSRWYDTSGAPVLDLGPAVAPTIDAAGLPPRPPAGIGDPPVRSILSRQVDYCIGSYTESQGTVPATFSGPLLARYGLTEDTMVLDGTEEVDGRELIRIVELDVGYLESQELSSGTEPPAHEEPELDLDHVTLVDPETHLPVMHRGYPGSEDEYLETYQYLPRTPENLALLTPPVPEGLGLVGRLPGDTAQAGRCD